MYDHRRPYRTRGSGRLETSCHEWELSPEMRKKSARGFAVFSAGLHKPM
jgi:hypothetical protein